MVCENCGNEFKPGETECSVCHSGKGEVKILTTEEKRNFQGVTIETTGEDQHDQNQRRRHERETGYVKYRVISFGNSGFLTKLLFAGILLFVIFVALPVVVFGAGLVLIIWFILRSINR
ncbi:hypothetical protein HSX37_17280|uniref:Zinc-ribbon domain-containing protein n=1 Tax=Dendrosporobacter quercicolus TaxID=146817 RepID=A0A1G9ZCN8_9FIRM|nr:hypothetical protein [Dendrosporobacter quercicolus]NSL49779.1 hypothetical protein [Dendrosporobacter quercicolus DSM 1736]SDN19158.1 hypothetical protein SAMN04488502_11414 [Dendrosporobacter quercicolus]